MKITIDTNNKTISVEGSVILGDLFSELERLLPDLKWREYSLQQPVSWFHYPYPTYTPPPSFPPYEVTCENNG